VLAALGVTPLALSLAGLLGNVVAGLLIAQGALVTGGIVTSFASALDILDGALARATGSASKTGAMIDSVLDRISEAAVLGGIMWYALERGDNEQVILAFIAVVGSLMVSYVRARGESLGLTLTDGLFTRPERVFLVCAALIFGFVRVGLWILAVLTVLTTVQRLFLAVRALRAAPPQ
jgi:CDP-diacylglycerol--glycerol-3-phosphate 3-phosphatidyltransferase